VKNGNEDTNSQGQGDNATNGGKQDEKPEKDEEGKGQKGARKAGCEW